MTNINRVVPTENWELVAELANGGYRIIETKDIYDKGFKFLAYPNQLKAFRTDNENIYWKNGVQMSLNDFYELSREIGLDKLKTKSLRVNYKNQAPTKDHKTHHVYGTFLHPFDFEKPISLSESIGGGHADMGGSRQYSLQELKEHEKWRDFLRLSDCDWIIPIVESMADSKYLIDKIVKGICDRSEFNDRRV